MSAIGGILHLHDEPIDPFVLSRFHQTLAPYGLHGQAILEQSSIALTHQKLVYSHINDNNQLPAQINQFLITHNACLANRASLAQTLQLGDNDAALSTTEIIVRAYQKWGPACVDHFVGEFTFAIWNTQDQQLFIGRDHVGLRPLFYLFAAPYFAFASEIKALKVLPFFNDELDDIYIGHFLLKQRPPHEKTTYKHIQRLAGGHCLQLDRNRQLKVWRYWNLHATTGPHYSSDEAYIDELRELLTQAVKNSLDTPHKVGSELSGGLDSSAVAAVASDLLNEPLITFSGIMPAVPTSNEEATILATASYIGADPRLFRIDTVNLPDILRESRPYFDDLYHAANSFVVWQIAKTAHANDIKVVLTGHDGNTMISDGYAYLNELALQGDWAAFDTVVNELIDKESPLNKERYRSSLFRHYGTPTLSRVARQSHPFTFWNNVQAIHKATGDRYTRLAIPSFVSGWMPQRLKHKIARYLAMRATDFSCYNADYAAQLRQTMPYIPVDVFKSERDGHIFGVQQSLQSLAGDVRTSYMAAFGVDFRHPLADRRLIEYSVNLPIRLKRRDGWGRWILRAAIGDKLPASLRWTRTITRMTDNFHHVVSQNQLQLWAMAYENPIVSNYLRIDLLEPTPETPLPRAKQLLLWNAAILSLYV